ncbi:hypothetical protein ANCDUO_20013, partial [Ancylostoma duodenale]
PYHGILLLEDVWPSPDANPSVTLLLKHCEPDRSILDMSTASGIPLLQVFLIVRHLLLWARAVVVYPLCNTNVYSSATLPKPLGSNVDSFESSQKLAGRRSRSAFLSGGTPTPLGAKPKVARSDPDGLNFISISNYREPGRVME